MEKILGKVKELNCYAYKKTKQAAVPFLKWCVIALAVGIAAGLTGCAFLYCLDLAVNIRDTYSFIIYLLPIAGIVTILIYKLADKEKSFNTDLVLESVHSSRHIPFKLTPTIFISTVITHLFGGSAGREGAALQIGGSIGYSIGKVLKLDKKDIRIITMCGMSAAFTALFGTPAASAVFALEVTSVGVMYYAALVPCAVSSVVAWYLRSCFGFKSEFSWLPSFQQITPLSVLGVIGLAVLCAILSILFCFVLHKTSKLYKKLLKNPYVIAAVGGALIVILWLVFGNDYIGSGINVVIAATKGAARPEAFALKLLFTAITLGAGFKGGEIVPGFFVGATFGCTMAGFLGLDPALGGALGLICVFCGITNCPLASLIIGIELFGANGICYYLIAIAISYMLSGYAGLYKKQVIQYSKYKAEFIGDKMQS